MDKAALNKLALYLHFLADEICNNLNEDSIEKMAEKIKIRIEMLNPKFKEDANNGLKLLAESSLLDIN